MKVRIIFSHTLQLAILSYSDLASHSVLNCSVSFSMPFSVFSSVLFCSVRFCSVLFCVFAIQFSSVQFSSILLCFQFFSDFFCSGFGYLNFYVRDLKDVL